MNRLVLLLIPCVALLLGGCGAQASGDAAPRPPKASRSSSPSPSPTPTPSTSASPSATPTPTAPASSGSSETPASSASAPSGPPAGSAVDLSGQQLPSVTSPSGDIACLFDKLPAGPAVRCDVRNARWQVPPKPSCQGAYGDSVTLVKRSELGCHTDTVLGPPHPTVLHRGEAAQYDDLTCRSTGEQLSCSNTAGRGFTISQTSYRTH